MDTALSQKFPFILDRNLAKANCTGNWVCTSCDTVVLDLFINTLVGCERTGSDNTCVRARVRATNYPFVKLMEIVESEVYPRTRACARCFLATNDKILNFYNFLPAL